MLIGSGAIFVLFSDSTEQPWNKFKDEENDENGGNDVKIQYSKVPLDDLSYTGKSKELPQLTN